MTKITILQLYPNELNVYGDNGNILCLEKRLEWRGIVAEIITHNIGDKFDYQPDIMISGGGQDSNQTKIGDDLLKNAKKIAQLVERGVPTLLICGSYQLFGQYFETEAGEEITGAAILELFTRAEEQRLIGNIVINSPKFGQIVGYENHSGQTFLGRRLQPLGTVVKGVGNNLLDNHEGVLYKNLIGTYCHGPILPKNPKIADFLIKQALKNRGERADLQPLDDSLEREAFLQASQRPR